MQCCLWKDALCVCRFKAFSEMVQLFLHWCRLPLHYYCKARTAPITLERETWETIHLFLFLPSLLLFLSPLPFFHLSLSHPFNLLPTWSPVFSLFCIKSSLQCKIHFSCNDISPPLRPKRLDIALCFQLLIIMLASSSPSSMIKTWIGPCWKFRGSFSARDRSIQNMETMTKRKFRGDKGECDWAYPCETC